MKKSDSEALKDYIFLDAVNKINTVTEIVIARNITTFTNIKKHLYEFFV